MKLIVKRTNLLENQEELIERNTMENKPCTCINWARAAQKFWTNHHERCEHYTQEVFSKSREHLSTILKHFRNYCAEGDGIPREMWEDYKRAVLFIGDIDRFHRCLSEENIER